MPALAHPDLWDQAWVREITRGLYNTRESVHTRLKTITCSLLCGLVLSAEISEVLELSARQD